MWLTSHFTCAVRRIFTVNARNILSTVSKMLPSYESTAESVRAVAMVEHKVNGISVVCYSGKRHSFSPITIPGQQSGSWMDKLLAASSLNFELLVNSLTNFAAPTALKVNWVSAQGSGETDFVSTGLHQNSSLLTCSRSL